MSNVVVAVKNQDKKTTAMELIFFPLMFMIFIGVIFNNFNASGLQANGALVTTQFTRTDTNASRVYCILGVDNGCSVQVNPQPTGCALNVQNCNASALQGIQFLNPNSPFTYLLQGNIVGFLSSIFNNAELTNTYQIGETICIPLLNGHLENSTNANIRNFRCFGNVQYNDEQLPSVFPPLNATSNYGNNSIWDITGIPNVNGTGNVNSTIFATSSFYGIYVSNGTTITATSGCSIYGSVQTCSLLFPYLFSVNPAFTCPNTLHVQGVNINKTTYYCLLPTNNPSTFTVANSFSFFAFFAGIILLVMGFGLNIAFSILTNGGSLGVNEQGTKLAQTLGIGLTIWAFVSSEFAWIFITNFGLNGGLIGTIISIGLGFTYTALTAMFFIGIYWRLFSLE